MHVPSHTGTVWIFWHEWNFTFRLNFSAFQSRIQYDKPMVSYLQSTIQPDNVLRTKIERKYGISAATIVEINNKYSRHLHSRLSSLK
jgi:hypothetical protein